MKKLTFEGKAMSSSIVTNCIRWQLAALLLLTGVAGCGGGDSAGSTSTGRVSVLFSDAPSDEFARINLTVTDIELRGGEQGPVSIFSGSQTFDLLALKNFSQLFSMADAVPAGTYNEVRLRISDLELVRTDTAGVTVETIRPPLPASGKIDMHAGRRFAVLPDGALLLEIDIDAYRSIHAVHSGNDGYRFRPVIRLRIVNVDALDRLARISGTIAMPDPANSSFEICDSRVAMVTPAGDNRPHTSSDTGGDSDGDSDSDSDSDRACVEVGVLGDTSIFDALGNPTTEDAFFAGVGEDGTTVATVVGQFRISDEDSDSDSETPVTAVSSEDPAGSDSDGDSGSDSDSDGDSDSHGGLTMDAFVIQMGDAFANLTGTVATAVDADTQQFTFNTDTDDGTAPAVVLTVQLQPETRIFTRNAVEVDSGAIQPDRGAEIDGILMTPSLQSSLVVVDAATEPAALNGTIRSLGTGTFVMAGDTGDECIKVHGETDVLSIETDAESTSVARAGAARLAVGASVAVYGEDNADTGCYDADAVVAY